MSVDTDILILEAKINKASARIAQAEKQYKRSVQKLEKQKKAVEIAHGDISRVKINIANQLAMLQKLKEFKANEVAKPINLKIEFPIHMEPGQPVEVFFSPDPVQVKE